MLHTTLIAYAKLIIIEIRGIFHQLLFLTFCENIKIKYFKCKILITVCCITDFSDFYTHFYDFKLDMAFQFILLDSHLGAGSYEFRSVRLSVRPLICPQQIFLGIHSLVRHCA